MLCVFDIGHFYCKESRQPAPFIAAIQRHSNGDQLGAVARF